LLVKPLVSSIDGDLVVLSGGDIQLTCSLASGTPVPLVTWYKDSTRVTSTIDARVSFISQYVVTIKYASETDGGKYICNAVNPIGTSSLSVDVVIVSK